MYFLLAAAGAAIALAVNQTHDAKLTWSQSSLAFAVWFWALSFYFGCRHLICVESALFNNVDLLMVESGKHPDLEPDPQLLVLVAENIRKRFQTLSEQAKRFARLQFGCLVLGALSYIGWHVLEMWLRS